MPGSAFQFVGNNIRWQFDDFGNSDFMRVGPCCCSPIDGEVVSVRVLVTTAAGDIRVGIYSDDNGEPDALLGESASTPTTVGWMEVPLTSPAPLAAGDAFWIALLMQDDGLHTPIGDSSGDSGELDWGLDFTYGPLPDPFPVGSAFAEPRPKSIFVQINPA